MTGTQAIRPPIAVTITGSRRRPVFKTFAAVAKFAATELSAWSGLDGPGAADPADERERVEQLAWIHGIALLAEEGAASSDPAWLRRIVATLRPQMAALTFGPYVYSGTVDGQRVRRLLADDPAAGVALLARIRRSYRLAAMSPGELLALETEALGRLEATWYRDMAVLERSHMETLQQLRALWADEFARYARLQHSYWQALQALAGAAPEQPPPPRTEARRSRRRPGRRS